MQKSNTFQIYILFELSTLGNKKNTGMIENKD